MVSIFSFAKLPNESEEAYLWRIGQAKDTGVITEDWTTIAGHVNREFREDEAEYRTEAAYRKRYNEAKKFWESGIFKSTESDELSELKKIKDDIYKAKKQLADQRREYNKLLIVDARSDHLTEKMIEAANSLNEKYPLLSNNNVYIDNGHKEALILFADWHYGMVTDNIWNKYNTTICKDRVSKFVSYCKNYLTLNGITKVHIVLLGDMANGAIHATSRILAEENACDQLMHVSEIIAQAIDNISSIVNHIDVHTCYGNHMRTIQNKKDSVHSDNMEKIIGWWLKQRLQNNNKIQVIDSEYREFTKINIFGKNIICVHGDLETFRNLGVTVNTIFSQKFGMTIDYTVSADKHHLEEFGQFATESILVRSLCGTDDHANNGRLYDKAGQTMIIFNDDYGREATYHVPLN